VRPGYGARDGPIERGRSKGAKPHRDHVGYPLGMAVLRGETVDVSRQEPNPGAGQKVGSRALASPRGRLALGAAGVTVVLWASAFVANPQCGTRFLSRCPRSRQARVRDGGTWRGGTGPARGMAAARRLAGHRDLRHALVRRLHGCAELGRTEGRCRHSGDSRQVTTFGAALARTPAAKMGATTYLVPAITVLVSWALLGQVPSGLAILGGALCLAGVALSRRRPHAPAKREPAPSLE
jgi:hypothetical protein